MIKVSQLTLSLAANETIQVYITGEFLYLKSSANDLLIRGEGIDAKLAAGQKVRIDGIQRLEVTNLGASAVTAVLVYGSGDFEDNNIGGTVNASVQVGATVTPLADVGVATATAVKVASSNANRKALHLYCDKTVRWGDATVTATKGVVLPAGMVAVIDTTAEIYVRNDSGATATVSMTEVTA